MCIEWLVSTTVLWKEFCLKNVLNSSKNKPSLSWNQPAKKPKTTAHVINNTASSFVSQKKTKPQITTKLNKSGQKNLTYSIKYSFLLIRSILNIGNCCWMKPTPSSVFRKLYCHENLLRWRPCWQNVRVLLCGLLSTRLKLVF